MVKQTTFYTYDRTWVPACGGGLFILSLLWLFDPGLVAAAPCQLLHGALAWAETVLRLALAAGAAALVHTVATRALSAQQVQLPVTAPEVTRIDDMCRLARRRACGQTCLRILATASVHACRWRCLLAASLQPGRRCFLATSTLRSKHGSILGGHTCAINIGDDARRLSQELWCFCGSA